MDLSKKDQAYILAFNLIQYQKNPGSLTVLNQMTFL